MSDSTRPNLFKYATSELSQDAFICWLAEWADPTYKTQDETLHETGREFVLSMIRKVKLNYEAHSIQTINVTKQDEKLDVLIEVNKDGADRLAILVEDKTHTSNHSDQLTRYYNAINKKHKYTADQIIPILLKTGYQSRFDIPDTYRTYLRKDFLELLKWGEQNGVSNAIYIDFLNHLKKLEEAVNQFDKKPLYKDGDKQESEWDNYDWQGFYMHLYEEAALQSGNWGYVANANGGFYGYWWYFRKPATNSEIEQIYLQLEEECLCVKIKVETEDKQSRALARDFAYNELAKSGSSISRPKRMGNGKYMTVAQWTGDFRISKPDGTLDFIATLANLEKAQAILDAAFPGKQPADQ